MTQRANDVGEVKSALGYLTVLPGSLGRIECLLAGTGYFSGNNVKAVSEEALADLDLPFCQLRRNRYHPKTAFWAYYRVLMV